MVFIVVVGIKNIVGVVLTNKTECKVRKQFKYHYDEWVRLGNRYGDLDEMGRLLEL